jgi:hypothetical protein
MDGTHRRAFLASFGAFGALAATLRGTSAAMSPEPFRVDRPFLYLHRR